MAPEWADKIMHICLQAEGATLMGSDCPPEKFEPQRGMSVMVALEDRDRGERIFNALAEGGQVRMSFQETFWAAGFGVVVDRFGTPWMINCSPGK